MEAIAGDTGEPQESMKAEGRVSEGSSMTTRAGFHVPHGIAVEMTCDLTGRLENANSRIQRSTRAASDPLAVDGDESCLISINPVGLSFIEIRRDGSSVSESWRLSKWLHKAGGLEEERHDEAAESGEGMERVASDHGNILFFLFMSTERMPRA
jgi:hypothetical protein